MRQRTSRSPPCAWAWCTATIDPATSGRWSWAWERYHRAASRVTPCVCSGQPIITLPCLPHHHYLDTVPLVSVGTVLVHAPDHKRRSPDCAAEGQGSAQSPRFSPDGGTLVYLSWAEAVKTGVHNSTVALMALEWPEVTHTPPSHGCTGVIVGCYLCKCNNILASLISL